MTDRSELWYLDRLRAELQRAAEAEDRRERRSVLGRLRLPPRAALAVVAVAALVAAVVIVGALLGSDGQERVAAPDRTPVPTASPPSGPEAALRRLDGIYVAEITPATIQRMGITPDMPAGWWQIVIRGAELELVLTAPEGGDTPMVITGAGPDRLTLAPDGNCETVEGRSAPASIEYTLEDSSLTLRRVRGGCAPVWKLITSTPWRKA